MTQATPQRTVSVSLTGRTEDDVEIAYSYWSPNDGTTRAGISECSLYQRSATNTLFLLDYASTRNGWTIVGTEPNPPEAPSLETIRGPASQSLMTMFPDIKEPQIFNFFMVFKNTVTGAVVRFDPQERNVPE